MATQEGEPALNSTLPNRHTQNSNFLLGKWDIFDAPSMLQLWSVVESKSFHVQFQPLGYGPFFNHPAWELLIGMLSPVSKAIAVKNDTHL